MVQTGRYEVRYGKYGAYFFDNETNLSLTLHDVLVIVNKEPYDDVIKTIVTTTEDKTVSERVIQVVSDTLGISKGVVLGETMIVENPGADSNDLLELEMKIEDEFNIDLESNFDIDHNFTTVYALVCSVNDKLGSK